MAQGGSDLGSDPDVNETLSSCAEGPPSVADVLAMTVDELKTELRIWGASLVGGTKPELQAVLLQGLGHVGTPLQCLLPKQMLHNSVLSQFALNQSRPSPSCPILPTLQLAPHTRPTTGLAIRHLK